MQFDVKDAIHSHQLNFGQLFTREHYYMVVNPPFILTHIVFQGEQCNSTGAKAPHKLMR